MAAGKGSVRYGRGVIEVPQNPPSDDQRQAVVARLTEHTGAGHLTLGEFDDRSRRAYLANSDGVDVEISGFSLLGGSDQHGSSTGGHPGGPLVRIRVFCLMGGTDVWRVPAETRSTSLADVRRQVKALGR